MICVGLDWGRDSHRFAIAAPSGDFLKEGVVQNKTWSFESWAKEVESHGEKVRLVLESGNGLSTPVEVFASSRGWEVARVTAAAVKAYREHVMGVNNKTDAIDARAIALLGSATQKNLSRSRSRATLRMATRDRDKLSKDKTRTANRLRQAIAEMMPEFTTDVIPSIDKASILHLLMHHPDPLSWARLGVTGIQQLLKAAKIRSRRDYIEKLVQVASQFRDVLQPDEKSFRLVEIRMLARRLKNYMDEHDEAVAYLELVSGDDEHVQLLETITGAGTVTAASIVAEIQDIRDFPKESKLASYVGVGRKKHQSGKTEYWANQTRSNRRLKRYFMHLALQMTKMHAKSGAYIQKKLGEGKKPLQARRALARQLVRVVYTMLKKSQPFRN